MHCGDEDDEMKINFILTMYMSIFAVTGPYKHFHERKWSGIVRMTLVAS